MSLAKDHPDQETNLLHSVSKEKQRFFKLPFFWRRMYTNEYGVIHHLENPCADFS